MQTIQGSMRDFAERPSYSTASLSHRMFACIACSPFQGSTLGRGPFEQFFHLFIFPPNLNLEFNCLCVSCSIHLRIHPDLQPRFSQEKYIQKAKDLPNYTPLCACPRHRQQYHISDVHTKCPSQSIKCSSCSKNICQTTIVNIRRSLSGYWVIIRCHDHTAKYHLCVLFQTFARAFQTQGSRAL